METTTSEGQRRLMEMLAAFTNYARDRAKEGPDSASVFAAPTQYEYEAMVAENLLLELRRCEDKLSEADIRLFIMGTLQRFIMDGTYTPLKG